MCILPSLHVILPTWTYAYVMKFSALVTIHTKYVVEKKTFLKIVLCIGNFKSDSKLHHYH